MTPRMHLEGKRRLHAQLMLALEQGFEWSGESFNCKNIDDLALYLAEHAAGLPVGDFIAYTTTGKQIVLEPKRASVLYLSYREWREDTVRPLEMKFIAR